MAYEVTIRCDIEKGNPLAKERCYNDVQARKTPIVASNAVSRDAVSAAERMALSEGWKRVRQPSRRSRWVCPACAGRPA
jgi:hypothetical protein